MLLLLALSLLSFQDPFARPGTDPTGIVVDEDGKAISGASVRLQLVREPALEYTLAAEQVVRRTPLPKVTTTADGDFVLPLTREHLRLGSVPGDGRLVLVIEKPGYQRWCEWLSSGVPGFLGSRAVLRRLRDADKVELQCGDVRPNLYVHVKRQVFLHFDPGELVAVPESGRLSVALPVVPSPPYPSTPLWTQGIVLVARTLAPGHCSEPAVVEAGGKLNEVPARPSTQTRWLTVTRRDGAEVEGLRGLYLYPDGAERWCDLDGDRAPDDPALPLVGLSAKGCRVTRAVVECELEPDFARQRALQGTRLSISVRDAAGKPIEGASLRASNSCLRGFDLSGDPPSTDAHGNAVISRLVPGTHSVLATAHGFVPRKCTFELGADPIAELNIELQAAAPIDFVTTDENGASRAGVPLNRAAAPDTAYQHIPCRTDTLGRGRVIWPAGQTLQLRSELVRTTTFEASAQSRPMRFETKEQSPVVLRLAGCGDVTWIESRQQGHGAVTTPPCEPLAPATAKAWLTWRPGDKAAALHLCFAGGPPARFSGADFANARRGHSGLLEIERGPIVRRVPLRVRTDDGKAVDALRIVAPLQEPVLEDRVPFLGNCAVREADGSWTFVARDLGEWKCVMRCEGYEDQPLLVPARAEGAEVPLELVLVRKQR